MPHYKLDIYRVLWSFLIPNSINIIHLLVILGFTNSTYTKKKRKKNPITKTTLRNTKIVLKKFQWKCLHNIKTSAMPVFFISL